MLQFIVDTINSLPGNWYIAGWLAFLFIASALAIGVLQAIGFIMEFIFEGVKMGIAWLVIQFSSLLLAIFLYPFRKTASVFRYLKMKHEERNNSTFMHTPYVSMFINQKKGEFNGKILQGPLVNSVLSTLNLEQVLSFYDMYKKDADTDKLMQGYMDNVYGSVWRNINHVNSEHSPTSDPYKITYQRALEIFELQDISDITYPDLKSRYRAVIGKVHPDRGGSSFFSKQANEALEVIKSHKGW